MSKPLKAIIVHGTHFEKWDVRTPDERGIGQSETANIELAWRLAKRGWDVTCYAPIPDDAPREWRGTHWRTMEEIDFTQAGYWLIFRQPELLDKFADSHPDQFVGLVSQDESYPGRWNDERAEKLDALFALCESHKRSLEADLPALKGKVKVAANGIKMELIRDAEEAQLALSAAPPEVQIARDHHRIMWASSPDRGLLRLLKIFRRLREWIPDASLYVAYGFDNIDVLVKMGPQFSWMQKAKDEIMKEANQPGVYWLGRIPQPILMREWLKTGLIVYPSTFRETYPVHGDSLVETLRGPVPIKDLVGKELLVYSCNAEGKIGISSAKNVTLKRTDAPVLKLTCRHGRGRNEKKQVSLTLTPDHEVMMVDGTYVQAGNLSVGDHVKAFRKMPNGWGKGYSTIGVTGQALVPAHHLSMERKLGRKLLPGEVVDHLDGDTANNELWNLEKKTQAKHWRDHFDRMTPEQRAAHSQRCANNISKMTKESKIKGSLAAAESRRKKLEGMSDQEREDYWKSIFTPERRAHISAISKEKLEAKWSESPWRNRDAVYERYIVKGMSTTEIAKEWGTSSSNISNWLKNHNIEARPFAYAGNHIIVKIESAGTADVYCMEVDPDHNFIADGIVVHNCSTHCEAQALGALPICSPVWALGEHAIAGSLIPGDPADPLIESRFVSECIRWMTQTEQADRVRKVMMQEARMAFNWERAVDKYEAALLGYDSPGRLTHSQFAFQLKQSMPYRGSILNVGCADDPADLAAFGATNVDSRKADPIFGRPTKAHVIIDVRDLDNHGLKYDCCVCGDMIEHFPVDAVPDILRKLKACLNPGGKLVLTIPDDHRPVSEQHAGSDGSHEYSDGVSAVHTHPIPRPMLDKWLEEAGLEIEFYQEIDCHWYKNHGVVCIDSAKM